MHLINRSLHILVISSFVLPISAYADSWSCRKNNDVREVHIERTTSEHVPCDVVYKKQTEGIADQVLWTATNDDSFCEEKAEELVAKLDSWGWVCVETISDKQDADDSIVSPAAPEEPAAPEQPATPVAPSAPVLE